MSLIEFLFFRIYWKEIHFIGKESASAFQYEGYWISLEDVCAFCVLLQ